MKKILKIIPILTIFTPYLVLAQTNRGTNISQEIDRIYNSALGIGGILAFVMIVVGGIYFTVSGSSDKKSEGKDYITSALWGLALLFGSFLILNTVNPQITELRPPAGQVIQEEGQGFSPSQCINTISDFKGGEIDKCEQSYIEHGDSAAQPSCTDDTEPICYDQNESEFTADWSPGCSGTGEVTCGDNAQPACDGNANLYCENTTGTTETAENVPDCGRIIDNCSDQFHWDDNVEISPGGGYGQAIYYPEDTSPTSTAKCVTYAYKINDQEDTVYADTHGLQLCN